MIKLWNVNRVCDCQGGGNSYVKLLEWNKERFFFQSKPKPKKTREEVPVNDEDDESDVRLLKGSLNSDDHQFYQYQQNNHLSS